MSHLFSDFRHSLRLLAGARAFSAVAILILGLGIGANTAVFSVVNTLVLQPRPGRIDALVSVFSRDRKRPDSFRDFSYPLYLDLRERRDIFDSLLAHTFSLVGIGEGDAMKRSFVEVVSANYFSTLGVRLAAGREFTAVEERPGTNAAVAIASYGTWRQRGFDPSFVGSHLRVNGADFTVVGVTPRGFAGTMAMVAPQWWFPLGSYDAIMNEMFRQGAGGLDDRASHALNITGALRPGLTREAAENAVNGVGTQIGAEYPGTDRNRSFVLTGVPRLGVSSSPQPSEAATLDLAAAHVAAAPGQDETALLGTIQRELRQMDSRLPLLSARTMTMQRDVSLTHWAARAAAVMFSTFGALALLLAAIGVYGLKAYDVARRTREIGIRIALGATSANVTALVLRDGLLTAAAGLAIGLLLALGLGRLVSGLLYQVSPFDPVTITAAAASLAGATLLATYLPARRATRIAPLEALRTE